MYRLRNAAIISTACVQVDKFVRNALDVQMCTVHLHKRTMMINEIFTDLLNVKPLHQIRYLWYK